jgi:hypothetical protein
MAYLSLQEVSATQSGQRQFKALDTESFDGYQKVAQYATHFVHLDDTKKVDLISKIPSTFTFFTLFENVASPYYVGPAGKLRAAEGRIFFKETVPGSFMLLKDYCEEATHFMVTMLATACELRLKSVGSVFPVDFLSVFKKNASELAVLRPISAYQTPAEADAPARVPRFVISLQKSVEDPNLMLLMPISTMPIAPNAKCDYYLEGHDQKKMALLVSNLRWNSRLQDFRFTKEDIEKIVKDLKIDATFHTVTKISGEVVDISDDEETVTFHAAAQIIAEVKANPACSSNVATEAEIVEVQKAAIDSNEPQMWHLFFRKGLIDGVTMARSAFIEDSAEFDNHRPNEQYYMTSSTDKTLLKAIFQLTSSFVKLPELIEDLRKNGLILVSYNSSIPEPAEPHSPASPPPELFDTEPDTPPENEVLYVFLDHDTETDEMTAVRKEFGPLSIADFAYDHEFYIRFHDSEYGLGFYERYEYKSKTRDSIQCYLNAIPSKHAGIQELPKIDEPEDEEEYDSDEERDLENERLDLQFTETLLKAAQQKKSVDDQIVEAVLEVASRKRTERCSDEPVSQPKRTRRPRRNEWELLTC